MPQARRKKHSDSPMGEPTPVAPVIEELARRFDLPTADMIPDPNLPTFEEKEFEVVPYVPDEPPRKRAENKTVRPFTGRLASGRGVTVTADDQSYAIESDHALSVGQVALAQRNGFEDFSDGQNGQVMVADKAEMRKVGGDINWVARTVTGTESGRGR